jgi:hypothetical protein
MYVAVHAWQISFFGQLCHTLGDSASLILLARENLLECVLTDGYKLEGCVFMRKMMRRLRRFRQDANGVGLCNRVAADGFSLFW